MSEGPDFLYLHKGRFRPMPGATIRHVAANAWEIRVPKSPEAAKLVRGGITAEAFDESVWIVDGQESVQALGSGETGDAVTVSVLVM